MRRPRWFYTTLGIFGTIVLAVSIWAVVTLIHSSNDEGTTTSLVLDDNTNNDDGMGNEAVNNYVAQLQKIYNAGSDNGSDNAAGMEKVTQAVDNAVQSKQGEAQAGSIRIAAMVLAYHNLNYDKVISLTNEINPDELSLQDQITYYATLYAVYDSNGDTEKAQEAFRIEGEKIQQLCSKQECMQ